LQVHNQPIDAINRIANPQPGGCNHLIVSAPPGVQLAPNVTQAVDERLFDVHVDVFQFGAKREAILLDFVANLDQGGFYLLALVRGEQTHARQHPGVGDRPFNIVHVQPPV
jgi:hypothetical protein